MIQDCRILNALGCPVVNFNAGSEQYWHSYREIVKNSVSIFLENFVSDVVELGGGD